MVIYKTCSLQIGVNTDSPTNLKPRFFKSFEIRSDKSFLVGNSRKDLTGLSIVAPFTHSQRYVSNVPNSSCTRRKAWALAAGSVQLCLVTDDMSDYPKVHPNLHRHSCNLLNIIVEKCGAKSLPFVENNFPGKSSLVGFQARYQLKQKTARGEVALPILHHGKQYKVDYLD